MRKFLSFNNFKASRPNISETFTLVPLATFGGVFGKVKLNIPKTKEAIEANKKVFFIIPAFTFASESQRKTKLINKSGNDPSDSSPNPHGLEILFRDLSFD